MKPALFYSLAGWSHDRVVAITSTKRDRLWYGRECHDNIATHGTLRELRGRFDTQEAAEAAMRVIRSIEAKYKPLIDAANAESSRLYSEKSKAIEAKYGTPRG